MDQILVKTVISCQQGDEDHLKAALAHHAQGLLNSLLCAIQECSESPNGNPRRDWYRAFLTTGVTKGVRIVIAVEPDEPEGYAGQVMLEGAEAHPQVRRRGGPQVNIPNPALALSPNQRDIPTERLTRDPDGH